ncbi:MAG: hypothetical protein FK734_00870 [Asgard group archaeon]|nr:hypothetical protein [Asgard group archaeon]
MRKKLFVLVIFMILPLTTGWLNLVQFDKVSSISGIQENSDLKAESHFDGAHVIAPGGYVEVSLFGLPEFSTYFESFIIWNLTSDIGLYCLLMNYYYFLNFANNDTYICEYLGPTGDTSTSIENEPYRIPFSSNHQTNYYVVFWNNNSIAANMDYEINLYALKAII